MTYDDWKTRSPDEGLGNVCAKCKARGDEVELNLVRVRDGEHSRSWWLCTECMLDEEQNR
jgi:hypothetical protein